MSYFDHLKELRNRLIFCFFILISAFVVSFNFSELITNILTYPLFEIVENKENKRMIFTGLPEVFISYLKISLFASFLISFPFFIMQISLFISPALYKREKNFFTSIFFSIPVLFYLGVLFSYYLLIPLIWEFFISFENLSSSNYFSIELESKFNEYMKLTMYLLFSAGISFLFPVFLLILAKLKIINSGMLRNNRKYYFIGILIFGAVFTPPDIISQLGIAIPLIVFFELSILFIDILNKK